MRIFCLTPNNPNLLTPETGFANELSKAGHDIIFAYTPLNQNINLDKLKGKVDIVVGLMEYSMESASIIAKYLNVPVYNHMEWIPPWRVGIEPKEDWGFENNSKVKITEKEIESFKRLYQNQASIWEASTVKSCAGKSLFPYIKPFCKNKNVDYDIHYYSANFDKLQKHLNQKIQEENRIVTTARLVPHKRVIHIVRALSMIKNPPELDLVGYGPEIFNIDNEARKLGVNINYYGSGKGGIKEYVMQRAMFAVQIWAGLPIAECLYYNKPSVAYDQHHMKEVLGDSVLWANNNNINDLSEKIKYMIENKDYRTELAAKGKELMLSNKIGMTTPEHLTNVLTKIMNKGINNFKGW